VARDPYKYFRIEARELIEGLGQGVLELEKGSADRDLVMRLLRFSHTLKGASRIVKQPEIAALAHSMEDILARHRELDKPIGKEPIAELLGLLDQVAARIRALDAPPPAEPGTGSRPTADEPFQTVRVEIEEMDKLLRGVTEAGVQLGALHKDVALLEQLRAMAKLVVDQLDSPRGERAASGSPTLLKARSLADDLRAELERIRRSLAAGLERVDGELTGVREVAGRLRLVPAHTIFPALARATRDAAQALGKRVELETSGGDVRLDAHVLAALRDALLHVVRNAVAHGVESPDERAAARKPAAATVVLQVLRTGNRVTFTCRDDGRGIDVEGVRRAALARGLISPTRAASMPVEDVVRLLLSGGLTTTENVSQISGRGVGLDVVRETALRLKGELDIRTDPGRGTTVEIRVPVSIASLTALVVDSAGALAAIPLDAVRQTLRLRASDVARSADRDSVLHDGKIIPFFPLGPALGRSSAADKARKAWSAVVVRAGDRSAAVGVDRVVGTTNIVMRSLPALVDAEPIVAGASLDGEGNPQLVLDPGGLLLAAERGRGSVRDAPGRERRPILVIDDSLTTRMLEQSILESAGYQVDLAVSAEEALEKACDRRYGLFIVDVEMPGMDGFEFVALTRSDANLRETPAILVTSRNAPEDKRRGEQAGASAYIVKSEFDQSQLLQTIRRLIG
jgi:two-component system, chemotaxis family, sensor kinase CheA